MYIWQRRCAEFGLATTITLSTIGPAEGANFRREPVENEAGLCLSIVREKYNGTYILNRCEHGISVAYCYESRNSGFGQCHYNGGIWDYRSLSANARMKVGYTEGMTYYGFACMPLYRARVLRGRTGEPTRVQCESIPDLMADSGRRDLPSEPRPRFGVGPAPISYANDLERLYASQLQAIFRMPALSRYRLWNERQSSQALRFSPKELARDADQHARYHRTTLTGELEMYVSAARIDPATGAASSLVCIGIVPNEIKVLVRAVTRPEPAEPSRDPAGTTDGYSTIFTTTVRDLRGEEVDLARHTGDRGGMCGHLVPLLGQRYSLPEWQPPALRR